MFNPFSEIVKGVEWVGKEIAKVATWVPKVIGIVNTTEKDAQALLPQAVTVFNDVNEVALAAIKDGGAALTDAETLVAAIVTAAKDDALNIAEDEAVVTAFEAFIKQVTTKANYTDVLTATKKLVQDYDAFGAAAKAAIAQLEQEVES